MSKTELSREELVCKLSILEIELSEARKLLEAPAKKPFWWRRLWGQGAKAAVLALMIICIVWGLTGQGWGFGVHDWQQFKENVDVPYVIGYYDGMIVGSLLTKSYLSKASEFFKIVKGWSYGQQIAIIDKYLKDNPDKWDQPFGFLVLKAYEDACAKRGFHLDGAEK